jgi:hypothetical protein
VKMLPLRGEGRHVLVDPRQVDAVLDARTAVACGARTGDNAGAANLLLAGGAAIALTLDVDHVLSTLREATGARFVALPCGFRTSHVRADRVAAVVENGTLGAVVVGRREILVDLGFADLARKVNEPDETRKADPIIPHELAVEIDVRASQLHNDGRGADAAFLRGVLDALAGRPMSEDMLDAAHTRHPYTVGYESTTAANARAHGYDPGRGRE